jgi:hypothetical protein
MRQPVNVTSCSDAPAKRRTGQPRVPDRRLLDGRLPELGVGQVGAVHLAVADVQVGQPGAGKGGGDARPVDEQVARGEVRVRPVDRHRLDHRLVAGRGRRGIDTRQAGGQRRRRRGSAGAHGPTLTQAAG